MTIQIFHELVYNGSLYMKMALWGCFVSVFDFRGEPALRPNETLRLFRGSSGTVFVVGRATSNEHVFGASRSAPMEVPSGL